MFANQLQLEVAVAEKEFLRIASPLRTFCPYDTGLSLIGLSWWLDI